MEKILNHLNVDYSYQTVNQNISPVIDVGTIGALGIMNRINDIDSSNDLQQMVPMSHQQNLMAIITQWFMSLEK